MKNNWSNLEAKKYIKKYTKLGHSKDMALRVYTTRLLGRNSELVLHGGGNTSVKTSIKDIDGKNYDVLCVKGSGWDMSHPLPFTQSTSCLLYTSPSPRDQRGSRMPSSA